MAQITIPVKLNKRRRTVTLKMKLRDGGWAKVTAKGRTPAHATMKAAALAQSMMTNPIFQAIAPPGSAAAVKAIGMLARGFQRGDVQSVLKKFTGKGAKRLYKKLKFW